MTEQKNFSAILEETNIKHIPPTSSGKLPKGQQHDSKVPGTAVLVIAITICAVFYLNGKYQTNLQAQTNQNLRKQLSALQQQLSSDKHQLIQQIAKANTALQETRLQQDNSAKELKILREKISNISGGDTSTWLLAQADYLVKLACRNLWSEQDFTTAKVLLKNAHNSLVEMNDPSIINVRNALMRDISTLSAISQIDYDAIILKLNQLSNEVDNLQLANNNSGNSPIDADGSKTISSSLHEWRQNLLKNWHHFIDDFITIQHRDNTVYSILAPTQAVYLRENIRLSLLIAAQSIPRHQDKIYKQSINKISSWIHSWYDTNDNATKAFLTQLDELSQQNIYMDVKDILESQPLLEKLMQTRVHNLLVQLPIVANQQGG